MQCKEQISVPASRSGSRFGHVKPCPAQAIEGGEYCARHAAKHTKAYRDAQNARLMERTNRRQNQEHRDFLRRTGQLKRLAAFNRTHPV